MVVREFAEGNRGEAHEMLQRYTSLSSGEVGQLLNEGQRLVALQGEQVCGFAALTPGHPGFYSLAALVEPAARGRGVGGALWDKLLSTLPTDAEMVCCLCPSQNAGGQGFLQAKSFAPWFSEALMHHTGPELPDPQLTARPYSDADFDTWVRVINECFYPMRKAIDVRPHVIFDAGNPATRQRLRDTTNENILFYDGDQLVGVAGIVGSEIDPIAVVTDQRRKGYGRRITAYCTNRVLARGMSPVNLTVTTWNTAARRMYEEAGYRVAEQRDWYRLLLK